MRNRCKGANTQLTTEAGAKVTDNQNSLTAGERGGVMMQDLWLMEKLAHFDREAIPERRMHAKGSGAFGCFTVTHDITKYTKAKLFNSIGKKTDVFVRFSTVAGERGAADAERDIRGFAIKFYTEDGNWDLVGNNTPVFFIRDGLKFPDLNHAVKRDPYTNMRSAENNWDFWTSLPEALNQVTIVMSDNGIPASYRHMDGFGSHTFSMFNACNERIYVKYHFKTMQGIKNLTDEEAAAINANDRESHQRDLLEAIENGDFPKWKMYIQVMTEAQANEYPENPFDITKKWYESKVPLVEVGVLELNRNPENYFADVEQVAFNPSHLVSGLGLSPDKLLQARLFSYGDAQRYRLGVNNDQIPVNRARCPMNSYHRDGMMRVDGNSGATIGYQPNSYNVWADNPCDNDPMLHIMGPMDRYDPKSNKTDNTYYQAGDLYREMPEPEKGRLIANTARSIMPVSDNIKYRHAARCLIADLDYGKRLAAALGLDISRVSALSKLSNEELLKATSVKC